MKTRREWAGQGGSVLLEVLIAGIVLGIAMVGLSLMISLGQSQVVGQGDEYVALYLAQQKIEQCIATGFGTCATLTETICYNCTTALPVGESGTQTFTRATTVTHPDANTDQITVVVTPTFQKADPVTLVTVLKNV